ncbi:MAG: hypothetical protein ACREDF_05130, partial [Thermoplasmata archaeon]
GLQKDPVNQKRLDEEDKRIAIVKADHAKVVEKAQELYRYELLVPEVLPDGEPLARTGFRRKYGDAMRELLNRLTGGRPAIPEDVRAMEDRIKDEEAARKEYEKNPGAGLPKPPTETGPPLNAAGVLTKAGVLQDPRARADINAAQRVYLYVQEYFEPKAGDQRVASLMFESSMWDVDTTEPPTPEDVWEAQLKYWIQKDVVDAIVALNTEAAARVRQAGEDPWIGNMPVKELIAIRLSDSFVIKSEEKAFSKPPGEYTAASPPGTPATVFTHSASSESFEVLQFTVKLVMDERDIPLLIERLCNHRFHTLLRVAYKAIPANRSMTGKIYGSEPAVNVVMDFETLLLGEVFRRWMPAKVIEDAGIKCRPQDVCWK